MVIVLCILVALLTALYSRRLMRSRFNPLSLFVSVWSGLIGIYSLQLLPYYDIEWRTWGILIGSGACFCSGCVVVALAFLKRRGTVSTPLEETIDVPRMRRITVVFYSLGCLLLIGFMFDVDSKFTFEQFVREPWHLRAAMMQGNVSWFVRYFYFTTPAAVLAFIHLRISDRYRALMRTIVLSSMVFGIATTGRTAVIWLLSWVACTYLFTPVRGALLMQKVRSLLVLGAFAVVTLVFFVIFGSWIGRTYANSEVARTNAVDQATAAIIVPYQYLTTNLPAFQNLIMEEPDYAYGKYAILPVVKVLATLTTEVKDLSEIAEFTKTPFLCNTYTYLWSFYLDFGLTGVFAGPFLMGAAVTWPYMRMKVSGPTLGLVFNNSLLMTMIAFTFIANFIISTPTWWFLFLGPILSRLCSVRRRPIEVYPDPAEAYWYEPERSAL